MESLEALGHDLFEQQLRFRIDEKQEDPQKPRSSQLRGPMLVPNSPPSRVLAASSRPQGLPLLLCRLQQWPFDGLEFDALVDPHPLS